MFGGGEGDAVADVGVPKGKGQSGYRKVLIMRQCVTQLGARQMSFEFLER